MENTDINQSFTMTRGMNRMKYVMLTVCPSIIFAYLLRYLVTSGQFPNNIVLMVVLSLTPMAILMYFLIYKKNHTITVNGNTVTETNDMPKVNNTFQLTDVASTKKDLLGDLVLLNADGKRLLTVERNMTNFDLLMQRISSRVR